MSDRVANGTQDRAGRSAGARSRWDTDQTTPNVAAHEPDTVTTEPHGDQTAALRREIGSWGIGLIVLGVLHFLLAGFLDPVWGIVLVVLGVLNLLIRSRGMFIANGAALILVGLMNMFGGGFGGWSLFGGLQIYWGIKEIVKFGKYADAGSESWAPDQAKPSLG